MPSYRVVLTASAEKELQPGDVLELTTGKTKTGNPRLKEAARISG